MAKGKGVNASHNGWVDERNRPATTGAVPSQSRCGIITAIFGSLRHRWFMIFHKTGGDPRAHLRIERRGRAPGEFKKHSQDAYDKTA